MSAQRNPLDRNRLVVRICLGLVLAGVVIATLVN
jgi:hypothetical protein